MQRAMAAVATIFAAGIAISAPTQRLPLTSVSHLAIYAADAAKSEQFYVHDLGAVKGIDPENPEGTRYYFSPVQYIELLPLPAGAPSINRLDHIAYNTTDAEAMRLYLASRKVRVPRRVSSGTDGSHWFEVTDPEGNRVQFVQPPASPPATPMNPLSGRIIHVGFIVHNRDNQDSFWRNLLGFRPYWYGG
ncbi:MAG TPA: VOC family protein, partial [Sphingomonas sp.]|nr:VOC family protein [Sphingomonas sp.]